MTKYRIDDTVEREKARLVVKGFTHVYGADYDETYALVSSYVTLRIFLSIVAVLDFNLMQLDMKNAFLQSKLDQTLLLWYKALNDVLVGVGWKKSQVDEALYFKVGGKGVACWLLVYVDDLLAASSSTEMVKELKELLEPAFEMREISPVQKHLGLEILRDGPSRKLWLHPQGYTNKLRRRFLEDDGLRRRLRQAGVRGGTGAPGEGVPAEGRLAAVCGDDNEAGHRLRLQQAGQRPYIEVRPAPARGETRLLFLLEEIRQLDAGKPTVLWVDSKSAITVASGMGLTGNLKHMEQRQAWLQHMVKRRKISLKYIPTA
ncbi:unnamed protein product [Closterium sp. Yama58-4]|nr:unnamed protein product [Closterium sp. Yama58-4]